MLATTLIFAFQISIAAAAVQIAPATQPVADSWQFAFDHALPEWKDGLPIGNGRIGAQCWGDEKSIRLTIDRGDVWDLRYQANERPNYTYKQLREYVRLKQFDKLQDEMTPSLHPLADLVPTRVSIGRLEIKLPPHTVIKHVRLDLQKADVIWDLEIGDKPCQLRHYAHATRNLIVTELTGANSDVQVAFRALVELNPELQAKLQYPPPEYGKQEDIIYCTQNIPESDAVVTAWSQRAQGNTWRLVLTVLAPGQADALSVAQRELEPGLSPNSETLLSPHQTWWTRFWQQSSVDLPDPEMQRLWRNGLYKLASSSHDGAPVNLQGLWPPDGDIPAWRGDYHFNQNVQQTYWPAYSSNHLELTQPLNRWLIDVLAPQARERTRHFFGEGKDALWIGCFADLKGRMIGGKGTWMTVQYWLGGGAWMAQHLWWYYRYSLDEEFLRDKAYPFMRDCMSFYEKILEPGDDGLLHIPLSTSPEYHMNLPAAWTKDPTCDLAFIRNLAHWCIAAAGILKTDEDRRHQWEQLLTKLAPYPTGKNGLKVQPDTEFEQHCNPIHLAPIFPLADLSIEGNEADQKLLSVSVDHWLKAGTQYWTGWSFPWGSQICSQVGRGEDAYRMLDVYRKAFIWPNGFHVNGDYKKLGYSAYDYQPFTVEGECSFTAAINHMLLQSWGGRIRVFPAVPMHWADVAFENLRAEGAVLVSAKRHAGRTVYLALTAEHDAEVKIEWPGEDGPQEKQISLFAGKTVTIIDR